MHFSILEITKVYFDVWGIPNVDNEILFIPLMDMGILPDLNDALFTFYLFHWWMQNSTSIHENYWVYTLYFKTLLWSLWEFYIEDFIISALFLIQLLLKSPLVYHAWTLNSLQGYFSLISTWCSLTMWVFSLMSLVAFKNISDILNTAFADSWFYF
jgi:hypothetical protein